MVPAKEAKELLYNLLSEKFINLQVKILRFIYSWPFRAQFIFMILAFCMSRLL